MKTIGFRDVVNVVAYRATLMALKVRIALQRFLGRQNDYQPDPFGSIPPVTSTTRQSQDRFDAIQAFLPNGPISIIDVGCNDGYFVLKLATQGGICIGIDQDRNSIMIGQARAAINGVPNALFANLTITPENAANLPRVDVVICLSVFHHWVRHFGIERANIVLDELGGKAGKVLVFETGQPNEIGAQWAGLLSFMGGDPDVWIHDRLVTMGFDQVHPVGKYSTTVTDVPRTLFVGIR